MSRAEDSRGPAPLDFAPQLAARYDHREAMGGTPIQGQAKKRGAPAQAGENVTPAPGEADQRCESGCEEARQQRSGWSRPESAQRGAAVLPENES